MNQKLKVKWVNALLSGRCKQARGRLRKGGGYCCLGVLCVASRAKLSADGVEATYKGAASADTGDFLPLTFGLTSTLQSRLVHLNDSKKKTFKEIAEFIQKNVRVSKAHD